MSEIKFYPNDLDQGPFMKFTTYSIKGGVGSSMSDINFGGPFDTVCLPIPSGLNTTYGQGWDTQDVGPLDTAAGDAVVQASKAATASAAGSGGSLDGAVAAGKAAGGAMLTSLKDSLTSAGIGDAAAAAFLGVTGAVINTAAVQRAGGQAVFTNTYATYGGPGFREFGFSFSLKALSQPDAQAIEDIVKYFKINSAPNLKSGALWRLYELPKVFQPTFHTKAGAENSHLPKIGKCALLNVGVTYGGSKYNEFHDSRPVQTDITLTFKEIALLSSQDLEAGF